jgi:hypothetical protein
LILTVGLAKLIAIRTDVRYPHILPLGERIGS